MDIFSEEHRRAFKRYNYQAYPWLSLPVLVTAIVLSIIYRPPLGAALMMLTAGLGAGVCLAYGPLSKHRWLENFYFAILIFSGMAVFRAYSIKTAGAEFFVILAWMTFGMLAPFWIWRKRGIEAYAPPVSSASH